jgi:arylsulfatase A-like enzyme
MVRSVFIALVFAVIALSQAVALSAAERDRPNILFIYTDDHSHRTVSCYPEAYDFVHTPNIDKLAENGVRFTHAYIGTWCMPSRAAMLTGHQQYGVESMRMVGRYPGSEYDPEKCPFWPSVFRKEGYVTAQIGKWHTGVDTGYGRDWDYQVVWNRPRYQENSGNYYDNQLIETNGGEPVMTKGYTTDRYTDLAEEFIQGEHRDAEKPWYLWLCFGAVHGPFTPAERHLESYPEIKVPTPADIFPPRPGKPEWEQKIEYWVKNDRGEPVMKGGAFGGRTVEGARGIHGNTLTDWVRQYHQGVLAIDESVGRLISALEKTGQLENTLVVFTSDQGFAWGQHGFCTKLAPYDATIRSPLIVSMPGTIPAGKVCKSPVSGVDLPPTFFSFAGLDLPWKMHGHDLKPFLMDPSKKREDPVLMSFTGRMYGSDTDQLPTDPDDLYLNGVPWWLLVMDGRYKYIRSLLENEQEELYDLQNDPDELHNLALQREYSIKVREMRQQMLKELQRTNAGLVDNLPRPRALPGE